MNTSPAPHTSPARARRTSTSATRRHRSEWDATGLIDQRDLWDLIEMLGSRDFARRYLLAWADTWPERTDDLWASVLAGDDAATGRQIDALLASGAEIGATRLVTTAEALRRSLDAGDDAAVRRRVMVLGELGRQTASQLRRTAGAIMGLHAGTEI